MHPPDKARAPPCPASGLLKRLIPSLCGCSPRPPPPPPRFFTLQLIKCGCLLSEDKVGYLLHLGAPECQRRTQFEDTRAGKKSKPMSAGSRAGRPAAATPCDPQSFQIWLQLTSFPHRGPDIVCFPGWLWRESPGDLLSGINILVPHIISLEGIRDAAETYTEPPCSFFWGVRWAGPRECLQPPPRPPSTGPGQGAGTPPPHQPPTFPSPAWLLAFRFHLRPAKATWLIVIFFFSMWGGEIWMRSFYSPPPLNNNALKMSDICN